jgi:hypothetical protein
MSTATIPMKDSVAAKRATKKMNSKKTVKPPSQAV